MKILPVNNYQTQNQKQNINFGSGKFGLQDTANFFIQLTPGLSHRLDSFANFNIMGAEHIVISEAERIALKQGRKSYGNLFDDSKKIVLKDIYEKLNIPYSADLACLQDLKNKIKQPLSKEESDALMTLL